MVIESKHSDEWAILGNYINYGIIRPKRFDYKTIDVDLHSVCNVGKRPAALIYYYNFELAPMQI